MDAFKFTGIKTGMVQILYPDIMAALFYGSAGGRFCACISQFLSLNQKVKLLAQIMDSQDFLLKTKETRLFVLSFIPHGFFIQKKSIVIYKIIKANYPSNLKGIIRISKSEPRIAVLKKLYLILPHL